MFSAEGPDSSLLLPDGRGDQLVCVSVRVSETMKIYAARRAQEGPKVYDVISWGLAGNKRQVCVSQDVTAIKDDQFL